VKRSASGLDFVLGDGDNTVVLVLWLHRRIQPSTSFTVNQFPIKKKVEEARSVGLREAARNLFSGGKGNAPRGVTLESVEAIDLVRSIGNIGAHMEKDFNLVVEIDPRERSLLATRTAEDAANEVRGPVPKFLEIFGECVDPLFLIKLDSFQLEHALFLLL
jgi:hypothetical protein